ncbi:type II toxin-antitoxin system PemK/MazF family toxin [Arthrospiribacter ruber]|uniref:mRNA interferase n=1 Tax=Arthrospiribacter ruber TaxID=2487934 RepID=A0A951IQC2_9BACT|nr:type II toxin-antitoxin system PemK/MazF family toxin [Arthrospiribacter ruber]MBW3466273.1 type II toxin-antitoxin system PemK/MazF family toxin [Arthrospiribacter ruber]
MKNGEVWLVNFEPQVGQEIKKTRPAIIVNDDSLGVLPLKIVVPLTDGTKEQKSWMVLLYPNHLNGLSKASFADCFQVKSLSERRFVKKVGVLTELELAEVKVSLAKILGLI